MATYRCTECDAFHKERPIICGQLFQQPLLDREKAEEELTLSEKVLICKILTYYTYLPMGWDDVDDDSIIEYYKYHLHRDYPQLKPEQVLCASTTFELEPHELRSGTWLHFFQTYT